MSSPPPPPTVSWPQPWSTLVGSLKCRLAAVFRCYRCYNVSGSSAVSPSSLLFPLSVSGFLWLSPPSSYVVFFLSFRSSSFGVKTPAPSFPFHSCSSLFSSSCCSFCPFVLFVCFLVFFPSPSSFCSLFSSDSSFFGALSSFFFLRLLLLTSLRLLFLFVCASLSSYGSILLSTPSSSVVFYLSFLSSTFGVTTPAPFLFTSLPAFFFSSCCSFRPFVLFVCFAVFSLYLSLSLLLLLVLLLFLLRRRLLLSVLFLLFLLLRFLLPSLLLLFLLPLSFRLYFRFLLLSLPPLLLLLFLLCVLRLSMLV